MRCAGFTSGDYAYCTREELADPSALDPRTDPPAYRHWLGAGECRACGATHGASAPVQNRPDRKKVRQRDWEARSHNGDLFGTHSRIDYDDGSRQMWWSPKGVRTADAPLYRSEHALVEPIILTEGEPDTDALVEHGFSALGTVCGAGLQPSDAALEPLRRREVFLWPDADDIGHKHMDGIAKRLKDAGGTPRIIDWTSAPPKGGAKDFFLAGNTPDVLKALIATAKPWVPQNKHDARRIDWLSLVANEDDDGEDWLIEPIIPRGGNISLYSPPKAGKSLFVLDMAVHAAIGRRTLDRPKGDPITVVYLDYEMKKGDLRDRIIDMQLTQDELAILNKNLHYYLYIDLPPLDTPEGGEELHALATDLGADMVVLDTMSRVISGPENDADTIRALYRNTIQRLKSSEIAAMRLDHTGKNVEGGQRGSSAKNDDVDVVWNLSVRDGAVRLRATHRRQDWVPEVVDLVRLEGPLRHERSAESWLPGAERLAHILDEVGIPMDWGGKRIKRRLRELKYESSNELIENAIRFRKTYGPFEKAVTKADMVRCDSPGCRRMLRPGEACNKHVFDLPWD